MDFQRALKRFVRNAFAGALFVGGIVAVAGEAPATRVEPHVVGIAFDAGPAAMRSGTRTVIVRDPDVGGFVQLYEQP